MPLKQTPDAFQETRRKINRVMMVLLPLAIFSLVLEYGFYFSASMTALFQAVDLLVLAVFVLSQVVKLLRAPNRRGYVRERRIEFLFTTFLVFLLASYPLARGVDEGVLRFFRVGSLSSLYIVIAQTIILIDTLSTALRLSRDISTRHISPARLFLASFILLILAGAMLLTLPRASTNGMAAIDALFTSTSAVCVTGLVVVDTATAFTPFGQLVIMLLIQTGGLGLMTFTTFFVLFSGRLSIRERVLMQDLLNRESLGQVRNALIGIVGMTLLIETTGALLLYLSWGDGIFASQHDRIVSSVFHSVSAFCNAGFSLFSANLGDARVAMNPAVNAIIASLIVFGGLGFIVIMNLFTLRWYGRKAVRLRTRLTAHTKLVLATTAVLIVGGAAGFLVLEWNNALAGLGAPEKIMAAVFQSISTRTAGFNTIDIGTIGVPSSLLFVLLMFIGASPGSTGGGIKTVTAAVIFLAAVNVVRGRESIDIAHRSIPRDTVTRASATLLFMLVLLSISVFALTALEQKPLIDLLFESVSAIGTVGLSRGITGALSGWSKTVLILTMLIGRVGPLTMMMALVPRLPALRYDYPSEQVIVG